MMILFATEISKSLERFLAISMFENSSECVLGSSDQVVEFGRRDEIAVLDLGLVLYTAGNARDFLEFLDRLRFEAKQDQLVLVY